ncbi:MAG: ATP-binding protein [Candidatus Limnocylindria bacterium]
MLDRLSFRVRMLLLVLVVALPPLVAFALVALGTTGTVTASARRGAAEQGIDRALGLLARALSHAERRLEALGAERELTEAVEHGDAAAVRDAYDASALPGWSVGVIGTEVPTALSAAGTSPRADPPDLDTLDRMAADGRAVRGPLVVESRLYLVVSSPLAGGSDAATLVAWRDETDELWQEMQLAAGGGIGIGGAGGWLAASGESGSELPRDGVASDAAAEASTQLTMADGSAGRLALKADPPSLDFVSVGLAPMLLMVGAIAALWAVMLAMAFARSVGRQMTALADAADLVRRGEYASTAATRSTGSRDELTRLAEAHAELARSLDERNRQIAEVASQVAQLPMGADAGEVARAVSRAAGRVTGNRSWTLAVLRSPVEDLLPAGRYTDEGDPRPRLVEEIDRRARQALSDDAAAGRRAAYVDDAAGEWVAALVAPDDDLDAVLLTPWSGRQAPSAAELDLFALLGQHAGTAIGQALLYARLRAQTVELERLAALQGDFLRSVTHDLQTPLTSIAALSAEARALDGLPEPAANDLRAIAEQAERLRRMVGQLLTVSRLGARAIQPRQEIVRAAPLIVRTWQALRPRGRSLELEPSTNDHLLIADADRLEQVLWAILDNAVKYSPPGSPVAVRLHSERRDDGTRPLQAHATPSEMVGIIEVVDRGPGMDRQTAARAFDQFYRSVDARSLAPDGSGIGLYAARGLVVAMGGTIDIGGGDGAGTTITIRLPAEAVGPTDTERGDGDASTDADAERSTEPPVSVSASAAEAVD